MEKQLTEDWKEELQNASNEEQLEDKVKKMSYSCKR